MPAEKPLFQKRDGDLAVEVRLVNGHRSIELLRQYEKDGEWQVTGRLRYADQRRGASLLKAARDWINQGDKAEGEKREADRDKELGDWTKGLKYSQRRLLKAAEGRGR
jgi:hypothetical protein